MYDSRDGEGADIGTSNKLRVYLENRMAHYGLDLQNRASDETEKLVSLVLEAHHWSNGCEAATILKHRH